MGWTFESEQMRNPNGRLALRVARRLVLAQDLRDMAEEQGAKIQMSDYEWYCVVEREEERCKR